jgi:hypothetical protein
MMSNRDKLIEMVEDGMLDPMMALNMCVNWMSEDDVEEMLDANELSERFREEEEEDDGQPDAATEWFDFDPEC